MDKWFPVNTERLILREFIMADEKDVHEYASDPLVSRFDTWGPNTPEETHELVGKWMDERANWPRAEVNLAVELKGDGKVIGSVRFAIIDGASRSAELGYAFNPMAWNKGYATEATRAVLNCAFSVVNVHRVLAMCDARNIASFRVMEKIGMRREGHFIQDKFQKGEWRDSYLYAALEHDIRPTIA
jgi:[ribosomal protein S5]-alanine N-acetyltransferase